MMRTRSFTEFCRARSPKGFKVATGGGSSKHPSGSGGGAKKKPKTDKESGSSTSFAQLMGVFSEGPSEGVIGGLKGLYLDETPVENSDGTKNFEGVTFEQRFGQKNQAPIPGFSDQISSETGVGVEVKHQVPVTRSFTDPNVDVIKVRIGLQLQRFPKEGGYRALSMNFRILIKEGNGPFVERHQQEIKARFSSMTEFEYSFPVNNAGGTVAQFQVRVERLTPTDGDLNANQRVLTFRSFGQSIAARMSYPYSAYGALQFEASQFSSIPKPSFYYGGRLIKIPSNATVTPDRGLDYSGAWDGTFIEAPIACADPAWIFYDLCINKLYGFGERIKAEKLDKWALYSLSLYCNELLVIGETAAASGGATNIYERRYRCKAVINDKRAAWDLLTAITSIVRGWVYWSGGVATVEADRPGTPSFIVTQADVVEGSFSYVRSPRRAINTIAHVTWINPDNFWRQEVETVTDHVGVKRYGIRRLEVSAFGCTSRYQAHRLGWAYLISDRLERDTVRFRMRAYGAYLRPGKIIKVMDVKETIVRFSGLVRAATLTTVTLDEPITLEPGLAHSITIMLPDGRLADRMVTNTSGTHDTLNLSAALPYVPVKDAPWLVTNPNIQPGEYRVISVIPASDAELFVYEVAAVQYVDEKYSVIDTDYYVPPLPPVPRIPPVPLVPLNVTGQLDMSAAGYLLSAKWDKPESDFIAGYLARYRSQDGEWSDPISVTFPSTAWDVTEDLPYDVEVATVDANGNTSAWVAATILQPINLSLDWSSQYSWID
jgi:predicted phage tail protein